MNTNIHKGFIVLTLVILIYLPTVSTQVKAQNISSIQKVVIDTLPINQQSNQNISRRNPTHNQPTNPNNADKDKCKLTTINRAASESLNSKNMAIIDKLFNDPSYIAGLQSSSQVANSCMTDLQGVWDNISEMYKIGMADGLEGLTEIFKKFKVENLVSMANEMVDGVVNEALQKACKKAMDALDSLFGDVSTLMSFNIDLGKLGNISAGDIYREDGTKTFKVQTNTPSTNSAASYFDSIWK